MVVDERLVSQALAAGERVEQARMQVEQARAEFQRAVRALYVEGASMREIADRLGVSHQRVHQLLDLPKPDAAPGRARRGRRDIFRCSFCDRPKADVRKLIAGSNVFICDGCVAAGLRLLSPGRPELTTAAPVRGAAPGSDPARLWRAADLKRCSFCSKPNDVVQPDAPDALPLVTAGHGQGICRECLDLCQEIVDEEVG